MVAPVEFDSKYVLPRDATESQRLNSQHHLIQALYDGHLFPPHIKLPSEGAAILDAATGTGIFLQDLLAAHSDIDFSRMVGCDISDAQFPTGNLTEKIELIKHSVLDPFPFEWRNSFDFVNQRFIVAGLKDNEWAHALNNLDSILTWRIKEPGKYLNLTEVVMRFEETSSIFVTANQICSVITALGLRYDCITGNEQWMKEAEYEDIQVWRKPWYFGARASDAALGKASSLNALRGLTSIWKIALAHVPHLLPEEVRSQEGGEAFLKLLEKEFDEHGGRVEIGMVSGRKPVPQ